MRRLIVVSIALLAGVVLATAGGLGSENYAPTEDRIAFTSCRALAPEDPETEMTCDIYLASADGSSLTRIQEGSDTVSYGYTDWSPDGSRIVYDTCRRDTGDGPVVCDIHVMQHDGSGPVQLTSDDTPPGSIWPDWSPDGARIAFFSCPDSCGLFVMDAAGGNVMQVAAGLADFAWSPDGQRIAFSSSADGTEDIYAANHDGSGLVNLTNSNVHIRYESPAWSPDGTRIAFTSNREGRDDVYVMNVNGSGLINLTTGIVADFNPWLEDPAWSPDRTRIAFSSGDYFEGGIYVVNADGSGLTRLVAGDTASPAWSPDSSRLAFDGDLGEGDSIYVMQADGSGLTAVGPPSAGTVLPVWSPVTTKPTNTPATPPPAPSPTAPPAGGLIAFSGGDIIFVVNNDGSGTTPLVEGYNALWSPDGSHIAFLSEDNIHVVKTNGSGLTHVTDRDPPGFGGEGGFGFTWSPDGKRIAFVSDRAGRFDIWTAGTDGSGLVNVTATSHVGPAGWAMPPTQALSWSPDGTRIAFASATHMDAGKINPGGIAVINVDGTGLVELTDTMEDSPAWSPDGSRIAFLSANELWVGNLAGTEFSKLAESWKWLSGFAWSPDGSRIAYVDNLEIYVVAADGAETRQLTDGDGWSEDPSWSPDGARIAFSANRGGKTGVYVMDSDGSNQARLGNVSGAYNPAWQPAPVAAGDADCSGEVNSVDALAVLRFAAGLQSTAGCLRVSDVDCDGDIDAVDALKVLRHVAGLPTNLPSGCRGIGDLPETG